ncbi:DEAD/DEAH box helicase [Geomonas sp.]|uniref:DEAD/DEAH box helicase n=1 Tax=Geomonas sp. TaxID=2651584 RepID=UPI002B45D59A|nr:DEAD/DEAH box helicase [Geomonas sp.]HJV34610.1 DEAD/DEAH box helicase [Geomonas sp.]
MDQMHNALLRHLLEMPAVVIYALADKVHLFNGFELCKREPVSHLSWSEDGSILSIELREDGVFQVSLKLSHGELSTSCNCGAWSPRGRCPHLVAAMATVKKALSPASFPMLQLPSRYLSTIRDSLLSVSPLDRASRAAAVPVEPRYALVVDRVDEEVRIRLCRGGVPVTLLEQELPPSVRDFLRLLYNPALRDRSIEDFLARFCGRYPVVYLGGDSVQPLTFDAAVQRSILLHMDLVDGEVRVEKSLDDGSPLDDHSMVGDGYYFDLKGGRVQKVDDAGANRYLTRLLGSLQLVPEPKVTRLERGLLIAEESFNDAQFAVHVQELADFLKRTALYVNSERASYRQLAPRYRLNILELSDEVRIRTEGVADGGLFPLLHETFWFFSAAGRGSFSQPLKAKKRVAAIVSACFAALEGSSRAERERIIRQALDTADFARRGVKSEARRIIAGFCQSAGEPRLLLRLLDREWVGIALEVERQAALLRVVYEIFGVDPFAVAEAPGEISIERKLFMKNLSWLRSALRSEGFSLAMGGDELEAVSWTITLDATRSSIDWFELRPEIRSDGELVDERELLEAIKSGGLFRRGNAMVMLDEESSRALALFASSAKREVVRVPRLQILDWIALRRCGVRVLLSPEDERIIESLTHFESIPQRKVPARLKATLRNYQREGYCWLGFLYEHRFGACLADDMGLGKTIQAIALMAGIAEGLIASELDPSLPHLVVVPPSLIFNWESELARFYPSLKVGVYRGQGRRPDFAGIDLVLTSYGVIQRDIEKLSAQLFNVIVFDEAQAIKNIHAETTGAVRRLKGRFKLTLTGTPVENHLGEYFSVMDLALPGLLGPYEQFRKQMAREDAGFLETLIRRTHPFILRRTKDMIRGELPPKVETDLYLEMNPKQKALYVRTVAEVKATVAEAYSQNAPGQARIIALTAILKLRQICLSARLLLREGNERSPKVEFLAEQLQELFEEGHSVLVFSQFTSFLDLVQEGLSQQGISYLRLDGSTPVSRRKQLVERFQNSSEPCAFLLSLKAGGRGLNLTKASYVFHLDPWWNPAVENQASDRAHRIGQQRQVTITRLLMRHTIEEKMMELKKRKLKLYRALLEDAEHEGAASIGREDFEFLLG